MGRQDFIVAISVQRPLRGIIHDHHRYYLFICSSSSNRNIHPRLSKSSSAIIKSPSSSVYITIILLRLLSETLASTPKSYWRNPFILPLRFQRVTQQLSISLLLCSSPFVTDWLPDACRCVQRQHKVSLKVFRHFAGVELLLIMLLLSLFRGFCDACLPACNLLPFAWGDQKFNSDYYLAHLKYRTIIIIIINDF